MLQANHPQTPVPALISQAGRQEAWPFQPLAFARALAHLPGLVFLDSASGQPGARSIVTAMPTQLLSGHLAGDWSQVVQLLDQKQGQPGGLFGWVGFDGHFVFGDYPHLAVYDHDQRQWTTEGEVALSDSLRLDVADTLPLLDLPPLRFQPRLSQEHFMASVRRAQDYIRAGDIYQVNLSHPFAAPWPAGVSPFAFYQRLREASPAPYAAFLDLAGQRVLSSSPESFLHMRGRSIETRPIKGTRRRFPDDQALDAQAARELMASAKENAELLMITDLQRNDLGQVCDYGSIHVPELAAVESFAQVFHLVSTVRGTLRPGVSHAEAFRQCFPGGSISGAPKKRALEIIHELEPYPRGLYTGALGYFGFNGESQFNIVIRTAVQSDSEISFHVGAGIVADSVPVLEYEETLHKAAGLLRAAK